MAAYPPDDDGYDGDHEVPDRDYDDRDEPIGSCEWCGETCTPATVNLCDSCDWQSRQASRADGEDSGFQPVT